MTAEEFDELIAKREPLPGCTLCFDKVTQDIEESQNNDGVTMKVIVYSHFVKPTIITVN